MKKDLAIRRPSELELKTYEELFSLQMVIRNRALGEELTLDALERLVAIGDLPAEIRLSLEQRICFFRKRLKKLEALKVAVDSELKDRQIADASENNAIVLSERNSQSLKRRPL